MTRSPDLSVVLATAHPGAPLEALLDVLLPQLAEVRGELILVDGSAHGLPTPQHPGVAVVHLRRPGADVFAMRAQGIGRASGWVVAFAEDHCMPCDDSWARQVLAAHREHGTQAAVTGAVQNGTADTAWNRGSFLTTFATVLDPLPDNAPTAGTPPPANVSIKREVLDAHSDRLSTPGFVEFELMPHLLAAGHIARAPLARMTHHQAHSAAWFLIHHFHNGRSTGGLLRHGPRPRLVARRAFDTLRLAPHHVRQTARELRARPEGWRADIPALSVVVALITAHALGQLTGLFLGPGRSPAALE